MKTCDYCECSDNLAKVRRPTLADWPCKGIRILCFECRNADWRKDIIFIEFIKPKKEPLTARESLMF